MLELCNSNPKLFWKEVKNIGIATDRKLYLPTEIKNENEDIIHGKEAILEEWKNAFKNIYDDNHRSQNFMMSI